VIKRYPGRFIGYAALAPNEPVAAADELERCVKELGFKAWNTHSNFGDSYVDDRRYWPIMERWKS
jgi:predicted TIM-barrel fold metal-dependent hydrolase